MSKAISRNPSGLDDATRAAVRRAAQREGISLGDWIDEAIRLRAQSSMTPGKKKESRESAPSLASGTRHGVAEIARRLQQRHDDATHDGLAQSLAAAERRLAEARSRRHAPQGQDDPEQSHDDSRRGQEPPRRGRDNPRQSHDDITALRRELKEIERLTGTANAPRSSDFQKEINELFGLLDNHIDAQRRAGMSETQLAPAREICRQLRLAVAQLGPVTAISDIRADLDAVGRRLDEWGGPDAAMTAIGDLSRQIAALRQQIARLSTDSLQAAKFEAGLVELARHVCMLAESGALAQSRHTGELEALSRSIGELVAAQADRGLATIRDHLSALVADFGRALDRAGQKNLVEIDARLRHLGCSLSQSLSQKIEDGLSRHAADAAKLQDLSAALAQKIDAALKKPDPGSDVECLGSNMMRDDEQAGGPRVVDLLGRLDAMQAALTQSIQSGESHRQIDLAQQIEKLAARMDQVLETPDAGTSLGGLESQIGKLAARLDAVHDETVKMIETIARRAGESAAQATLEKGVVALPAAAQSETLETLHAVHDWLARAGERFATVEGVMRQILETQNLSVRRDGQAPDIADILAHASEALAPAPVVEALAIPMAGEALAVDVRATQAGFIAAARRAARQTARGRWTQDGQTSHAEAAGRRDSRFLASLSAHRRSALIALGAVMLLAGAYQLTENVSFDGGPQITASQSASPPSRKEIAETAARAPATSSKQASAVDPAPVGAIVNPGRSGVVASMNSAMALATLAANGDAAAQFELASRYADGREIVRDAKLAVLWFEKAAKQGLAPAQYRMGALYEKGVGVERNEAIARDWYRRAADAGNVRAMHNLAVMLAEGGDGKPDYAAAADWFRKAAELGLRDSQFNLAILYARGLGVETSLVQSYLWFAAAAAQGDVDAGKKRDEVAARLGARDLETAKALTEGFHAKTPVPAANEVATPPGGWRAPAAPAPRAPGKPKMSWFQSF